VIVRRPEESIHKEEGGWFEARWHFSFDHYRDPENMGIGPLRVFNDDTLIPGAVWPLHPHRDVEGLTYVVEGRFKHEDDQGNDGEFPAGSVQRMTLGRGAWHSEQNASGDEPVRFIQMWILPHTPALPPSCEQRIFTKDHRRGRMLVVFCPDKELAVYSENAEREGLPKPIPVHGNSVVAIASLASGEAVEYALTAGGLESSPSGGYLYVISGEITVNDDVNLGTGDAAKIFDEREIAITAASESELIIVDVPQKYTPVGVWALQSRLS
jgi:redox-sensitive bicupin YhaK (pirin superfamily)